MELDRFSTVEICQRIMDAFKKLFSLKAKNKSPPKIEPKRLPEDIGKNLIIPRAVDFYDTAGAFIWDHNLDPTTQQMMKSINKRPLKQLQRSPAKLYDNTACPLTTFLQENKGMIRNLVDFNKAQDDIIPTEVKKRAPRSEEEYELEVELAEMMEIPPPPRPPSFESDDDTTDDTEEFVGNFVQKRPFTVRRFPTKVANIRESESNEHKRLQRRLKIAMNRYQREGRKNNDILNINMTEKSNSGKWNVIGLIDPNKHLSTYDHSLNLEAIGNLTFDIVNYHHWIPSVFQVNDEGTHCQLLSEIPNLNPYGKQCRKTLYPLISQLFLHQLPQFENVLGLNLRDVPLRVIVKAQDYQLSDCKEEDCYLGNQHKEGLYEDIAAVGLYYYQIDDGIKGGQLELSSVIRVEDDIEWEGRTALKRTKIPLSEGSSLVFSNSLCYHRVCPLFGTGSRKIMAFFLLRNGAPHSIDSRSVIVNLKHHTRYFVMQSLRKFQDNDSGEWLIGLIQQYVVGSQEYIAEATNRFRHCRKAQGYTIKTSASQMVSGGHRTPFAQVDMMYHDCNLD